MFPCFVWISHLFLSPGLLLCSLIFLAFQYSWPLSHYCHHSQEGAINANVIVSSWLESFSSNALCISHFFRLQSKRTWPCTPGSFGADSCFLLQLLFKHSLPSYICPSLSQYPTKQKGNTVYFGLCLQPLLPPPVCPGGGAPPPFRTSSGSTCLQSSSCLP
jgi:hypothetical protein